MFVLKTSMQTQQIDFNGLYLGFYFLCDYCQLLTKFGLLFTTVVITDCPCINYHYTTRWLSLPHVPFIKCTTSDTSDSAK